LTVVATVDFHLHTQRSDGALTSSELRAAVVAAGIQHWSVTDHDTLAAWRELAGSPGLIPGVEITAGHLGREVHVVALGIDPEHAGLTALLTGIRAQRRVRLAALIARLPERHRHLTPDDCADGQAETLGRNHLARVLVAAGAARTISDVFRRWLGDEYTVDSDLPAFPPLAEVVAVIRAAGGVAILAHPGVYGALPLVRELASQCDGLEVRAPGLEPTLRDGCEALAKELDLFMSVGSDLHFLGQRKPGCYGGEALAARLVARLVR